MVITDSLPSVRSIRTLIRRFERRHAPATGRAATLVLGALGLYVGAGLLWWLFTLPPTVLTASSVLVTGQRWTSTWGWAVAAAAVAAGAAAGRAVGPVTISAELGFWVSSTLLDRGALVRSRVVVVLGCGALVGALAGRIAAFAAELTVWFAFTVLTTLTGVVVVALCVLVQCRLLAPGPVTILSRICALGSVAAVCTATAGVDVALPTRWWPVAAVGALAATLAAVAVRWCHRIAAAELAAGADTTVAVSASATALDISVLLGALEHTSWRRIGRRRTRSLAGGLSWALIRSDVLRHLRRPVSLLLAFCAIGAVGVAPMVTTPPAVAVLYLTAVVVVAMIFSAGLRDVLRDRDFGAVLGVDDRRLQWPLTVVPGIAAVLAAISMTLLTGGTVTTLAIGLVGGCAAAYRVRTRPSISYDGLILETAVGQIPVDLLRQWLRGPDVLLAAAWLAALFS